MKKLHEVILNEEKPTYRHSKNEDGSFSAYDLRDTEEGGVLAVRVNEEVHLFMKEEASGGALEGWRSVAEQGLGGAVRLLLLEPNKFGSSFLTRGVIVKEGMELGTVDLDGEMKAHRTKNIGAVASVGYMQAINVDAVELPQPQTA